MGFGRMGAASRARPGPLESRRAPFKVRFRERMPDVRGAHTHGAKRGTLNKTLKWCLGTTRHLKVAYRAARFQGGGWEARIECRVWHTFQPRRGPSGWPPCYPPPHPRRTGARAQHLLAHPPHDIGGDAALDLLDLDLGPGIDRKGRWGGGLVWPTPSR